MTLRLQEYLRLGGHLEGLTADLGINIKRHGTYPNLVLLKYNQIESPMANPIVQECRGIILDQDNDWNVVFHGMNKFFNHGEEHQAPLDWETVRFQEKVDGSLIGLYFYNGKWEVCSSGTPDASGNVGNSEKSFREYFWATLGNRFEYAMNDFCYWFELTGPANRVVVPHQVPGITLLGARNLRNGKEVHGSLVSHIFPGVPLVKEFPLRSMEDLVASFTTMSPLQQEGYVLVDAQFNRRKSKHPGYVALHHAKDGMTSKAFVEIARTGETSEVVAAFPEFKPLLDDAKSRYEELLAAIEADYAKHKDIVVQKDFAVAVRESRCSAACFQLRAGKVKNVREFLAKVQIEAMMRMLGY